METDDCWLVMVISTQLKVNNLVALNGEILADSIEECLVMLVLNVIKVLPLLDTFAHELIDTIRRQDWFQMSLLVWVEVWLSVQVDAERWHVHDGGLGVPEVTVDLVVLFTLNDDLPRESKVSVEPSSPEAATVELDVHLLVAKGILFLGMRSKFDNWGVSVASNNLEKVNTLVDLLAECKRNDGRLVPREIVRLSWRETPFIPNNQNKSIKN